MQGLLLHHGGHAGHTACPQDIKIWLACEKANFLVSAWPFTATSLTHGGLCDTCLLAEQQADTQLQELHSPLVYLSLRDVRLLAKQGHGRQLLVLICTNLQIWHSSLLTTSAVSH